MATQTMQATKAIDYVHSDITATAAAAAEALAQLVE